MFQKMPDEEIQRRLQEEDAQNTRNSLIAGSKANLPKSNPLHKTSDSEFRERYGGSLYQEENNNPAQNGIQNATITTRENHSPTRKRKKLGFLDNKDGDQTTTHQASPIRKTTSVKSKLSIFGDEEEGKNEASYSAFEKAMYAAGYVYGQTIGRGLMTTAYIWTNFIYLTLQIWLGIIAVIAIGLVFAIEYFVGGGITKEAFNLMMATIGVDWDFYLVATLFYLLVVIVCYIQLFGVMIQAKTLGLHPLGGSGGFLKTSTFLCIFILYWIPIFNCLPLVNLYIMSIQAYPR